MDPLGGSPWSSASTVAGFAAAPANQTLLSFAADEIRRGGVRALDIGCGAARNAVPLARLGWIVVATDLSQPMLEAAAARAAEDGVAERLQLACAPMDALPVVDSSVDLIVAHGIWNLARSGEQFRGAVREAARVARRAAGLFVFTFSRHTLSEDARPVPGETFVFTQFSGQPQCFLTEAELLEELADAGFAPDPAVPLTEHNLPRPGSLRAGGTPVIYEAAFRFTGPGMT